jgi:hypothetical protein
MLLSCCIATGQTQWEQLENDLRYQAMTRRNNGPSSTRGEILIRAIRQVVTRYREQVVPQPHVDEAALPPLKALELAALEEKEWKPFLDPKDLIVEGSENFKLLTEIKIEHLKQFERWIGKGASEPEIVLAAHQG